MRATRTKNPARKLPSAGTSNARRRRRDRRSPQRPAAKPEGFGLVGDHRNDENLIVAQTHVAFLEVHNKVCDQLAAAGRPADAIFMEAWQIVTWHYRGWSCTTSSKVIEKGLVARIPENGRRFFHFRRTPFMPVEFSAAASARPQHGA
jgi:hypothetical protein